MPIAHADLCCDETIRLMLFNRKWTTHECAYLIMLAYPIICSCHLDLDLMTLIYELDPEDVPASKSRLTKVRART